MITQSAVGTLVKAMTGSILIVAVALLVCPPGVLPVRVTDWSVTDSTEGADPTSEFPDLASHDAAVPDRVQSMPLMLVAVTGMLTEEPASTVPGEPRETLKEASGAATVMRMVIVELWTGPCDVVPLTTAENDPVSVGVPLIVPEDESDTPDGKDPEALEKLIPRLPVRVIEEIALPDVAETDVEVAEILATG